MDDLIGMLPAILDQFDEPGEVRSAVIFAAWKRAAGDSLRNHTIPARLEDKHLTIFVRDEMWKKHLEELAGQMIFKLNSILGKAMITFIEFKVNENGVFDPPGSPENENDDEKFENKSDSEISKELRSAAEAIEDEGLREQFLRAAGHCLVRKKRTATLR